jgi:hypothetical protein
LSTALSTFSPAFSIGPFSQAVRAVTASRLLINTEKTIFIWFLPIGFLQPLCQAVFSLFPCFRYSKMSIPVTSRSRMLMLGNTLPTR